MADYHFTTAYCPWANGTVEVVCRELLRATRALLSEFQLPSKSWPAVLPLVQAAINNVPSKRPKGRCPITVFTGLPQSTSLLSIKETGSHPSIMTIESIKARQLVKIEQLHRAIDEMHKEVADASKKARESSVRSHNRKTGIQPVNFGVGDYVLKGLLRRELGPKTSLRWVGPFQVVDCHDNYIFRIQHLLSGKSEDVHGRRLKFFKNSSFNVDEEMQEHLEYQDGELLTVEELCDIRSKSGKTEVLVQWKGFSADERDWVDVRSLRDDIPELLDSYLTDVKINGDARQRKLVSSL